MNAPVPSPAVLALRPEAAGAPTSGIVDVFNYGRTRPGLIPLWVGEGDLPTPAFICEAATRSLAAGETFYTYQRGIPELREALARYHERLYRHALRSRALLRHHAGACTPPRWRSGWSRDRATRSRSRARPGRTSRAPSRSSGARPVEVPLAFDALAGWSLDLDRLAAAVTPRTRALLINSPANPTGWTATEAELRGILALARAHGLWIVADEIYAPLRVRRGAPPRRALALLPGHRWRPRTG